MLHKANYLILFTSPYYCIVLAFSILLGRTRPGIRRLAFAVSEDSRVSSGERENAKKVEDKKT